MNVAQNCILRAPQTLEPTEDVEEAAECNSAAQQSETLRYEPERSLASYRFLQALSPYR